MKQTVFLLAIIIFTWRVSPVSSYGQSIPYRTGGTQKAGFYFIHQPVVLPKALRQLSSKQVVCKRISSQDHIVTSAGFTVNVGKYYPLDSFNHTENFIIINLSDSAVLLFRHIKSLLAIREVKTSTGKWVPVEHQSWADCRTGDQPVSLAPGQLILIRTRKTTGTDSGVVRLRMVARNDGRNLLFSEPYETVLSNSMYFIDSTNRDFSVSEPYSNLFQTNGFAEKESRIWMGLR